MAPGESDLKKMLANLSVTTRPGRFAVARLKGDPPMLGGGVEAVLREDEAITVVATTDVARERGWPFEFEAAWLTLEVHSALDGVGLTAAVSAALAESGIACNMLAGYYHDHLLVPYQKADAAIRRLQNLGHDGDR